jgi:hypothetical protein
MTTLYTQPKGKTMSVKDTIKAIPSKLKTHWNENKDSIKNVTIVALATTTAVGYVLIKAVSKTRDDYLERKGLTQDFSDYLLSFEDDEES